MLDRFDKHAAHDEPELIDEGGLRAPPDLTGWRKVWWWFDFIILVKLARYQQENDFVKRYGDPGDDEFDGRGGTIPQRLVLMNGQLVKERTKENLGNASSQIGGLAPDNRKAVEAAYLAILTRRPTPAEAAHFEERLAGTREHPS